MRCIFRRVILTGLIASCIFALAGCSSDESKEKEAATATQAAATEAVVENRETVTLNILENDTAKDQGYLKELLDAFNEAYKDKGIVAVDANIDQYTDLAKNGPYGGGPDVLYQANDKLMDFAEQKLLMPINKEDYDCNSCTSEAAWAAFNIVKDGVQRCCGIPVNVQEAMLFYRADNLPENWETEWDDNKNNEPDFFENWNDLYAYSLYLRQNDPSPARDSQYGYVAPIKDVYFSSGFLFSYGGYVFGLKEDGSYDTADIGFSKGNAAIGAKVIRTLASVMNEGCIDDSVKTDRYEKVANKTYFCAVSTPDTYTLFLDKLEAEYKNEGMSDADAAAAAEKNMMMINMPKLLPADGDLTKDSSTMGENDWVKAVYMGGINGYGINSYSEHKEEAIEFVKFATSYEMIKRRAELLGIAATRDDVASLGTASKLIFDNLADGRIYLMPSCSAISQIWKPGETFLSDLAKDPFREQNGEAVKYGTEDGIIEGLKKIDQGIYDGIFTLSNEGD